MKRAEQRILPVRDLIEISATTVTVDFECPPNTKGLMINTAGTLNITMENGNERDGVPLASGFNPCFITEVRSGGTASGVFCVTD